jgi:hypothetical protein
MPTRSDPPPRGSLVVPFRRLDATPSDLARMAADFAVARAAGWEVLVADGSPPAAFARHAAAWRDACRHVPLDPRWQFLNGKVNGVMTGVEAASADRVVLADDDVAYDAATLERVHRLLDDADLVVPQNYFRPLPWWARIESGRILLNRAVRRAGDYPGTFGVRRSTFLRIGPYDGDVLFENEELRRHFLRHGTRVRHARDLFVARRPPALGKWREQRLRQAYEDVDAPAKTALFLALLPVTLAIGATGGAGALVAWSAAVGATTIGLAARGLGDGARRWIPASVCLTAPLWVLERALTVHPAVVARLRGVGCAYGGRRIQRGVSRRPPRARGPRAADVARGCASPR